MRRFNKRISRLLVVSLLFTALTAPLDTQARKIAARDQEQPDKDVQDQGLRFRLSEAPDQPEAQPTAKFAPTSTLSETETENILKRLAPIKAEATDEPAF